MKIESLQDISDLLVSGFDDWGSHGRIYIRHSGDLSIFNYQQTAIFDNRWDFLERVSRGLIINNKTGEIVARPFDKFFNWGERDRRTNANVSMVTEKMDGSLGILYMDEGSPFIATRGSFDGEQAVWATEYLQVQWIYNSNYEFPPGVTLLFEIIYPENRIIVDYGDREDLVLIAGRYIESGNYLTYRDLFDISDRFGFTLVPLAFENMKGGVKVTDLILGQANLNSKAEGWVAYFDDGSIFKFKSHEYMALQKKIMGLSFKNTLQAVREGTHMDIEILVPEEFLKEYQTWVLNIQRRYMQIGQRVSDALDAAPKTTRKEFALWVLANYPDVSHVIFACVDGKDYENKIFDQILKGGEYGNK